MRNILPPSPFRSVWTFLVYCLTLSTPLLALLNFLGNVDLIATYADHIGKVLTHPLGMWIPVVVGFVLLVLINYRQRSEPSPPTVQPPPQQEPGDAIPHAAPSEELQAENQQLKQRIDELQQQLQRKDMEDEHGHVHWGEFQGREIGVSVDAATLEAENEQLKQQNEELFQKLDERKRERIEGWREFFENFDYVNDNVLLTAAYSDISPFLKDEIKDAFQNRRHVRVELDNRTGTADTLIKGQSPASQKTLLLDEIVRIERDEWERI